MTEEIIFPPLMWGEATTEDVMDHAVRRATLGCDAGLVAYNVSSDRVSAALVFAPEVPLSRAIAMLPLCGVGFQNALGALAPPEVAVHLGWAGDMKINGANCGQFTARAATDDPDAQPDWLVIGWTLPLLPESEDTGLTPDQTALYSEGCADVNPATLVQSWARHTLAWISRWDSEGVKPLHTDWRGVLHGVGEPASFGGKHGTFLGVDEDFGMLLRDDETTHLIPMTDVLEATT